jgi:1,4-dihydroxy-2-naphthoyl-CoA hydrolase
MTSDRTTGDPMPGGEATKPWTITLGALDEKLGIRVLEQSAQRVVATMPVAGNTQSLGRLHGGATAAFAEALGSWCALIHASTLGKVCADVDLNITHHRGATDGILTGTAMPVHLGRTTTSHEIVVTDAEGRRICTARITNQLIAPR